MRVRCLCRLQRAPTKSRKAPNAAASTPIEIGIKDFVVRAIPGIDMRLLFDVQHQ